MTMVMTVDVHEDEVYHDHLHREKNALELYK